MQPWNSKTDITRILSTVHYIRSSRIMFELFFNLNFSFGISMLALWAKLMVYVSLIIMLRGGRIDYSEFVTMMTSTWHARRTMRKSLKHVNYRCNVSYLVIDTTIPICTSIFLIYLLISKQGFSLTFFLSSKKNINATAKSFGQLRYFSRRKSMCWFVFGKGLWLHR